MWITIIPILLGIGAGILVSMIKRMSKFAILTNHTTYTDMLNSDNANISYKSYNGRIFPISIKVSTLPRFTALQIQQFYNINPTEWRIESVCEKGVPLRIPIRLEPHESYHGYDSVAHPVFFVNKQEWYKYLEWAKETIDNDIEIKESKIRDDSTEKVLMLVQGDIDRIREEHNKALQEAAKLHAKALVALAMEHKEIGGTSN